MNRLTDILRKELYGSDALMGNSYVEGLEAAINEYISEIIGEDNCASLRELSRQESMDDAQATREMNIYRNQLRAEQRKAAGL